MQSNLDHGSLPSTCEPNFWRKTYFTTLIMKRLQQPLYFNIMSPRLRFVLPQLGSPYSLRMGFLPAMCWGRFFSSGLLLLKKRFYDFLVEKKPPVVPNVSPKHIQLFSRCQMVSVGELYQPFGLWTTFLTHHVESFAGQPIGQNSGSSLQALRSEARGKQVGPKIFKSSDYSHSLVGSYYTYIQNY